jgi:hypothetical protein
MYLDVDELRLFFKLYPSLLCFVNQRHGIVSMPCTTPQQFGNLAIVERIKLRDALVKDLRSIQAFAENPFKLRQSELDLVNSWRDLVAGKFYVYRALKKYTVLLTAAEPVVAYGALALTDPLEKLIGGRFPYLCETVLLPFKGRIVCDGMIAGYNVTVGGEIRRALKESYAAARQRQGIITSLPAPPLDAVGIAKQSTPRQQRLKSRGKARPGKPAAAEAARQAVDEIVAITDLFCQQYLDQEYAALCRKLAEILARQRPSPLVRGKPESWASGIVRVIGSANFLNDPSQPHSMNLADIDKRIGVSGATGAARAAAIRELIEIHRFDPDWTLPSRAAGNPLVWMIEVNGFIADARHLPRNIQEEAFRKGLIPLIPADQEGEPSRDKS